MRKLRRRFFFALLIVATTTITPSMPGCIPAEEPTSPRRSCAKVGEYCGGSDTRCCEGLRCRVPIGAMARCCPAGKSC